MTASPASSARSITTGPVAIVGGGVVGVATAWELRQRGFEVDLFEQHPELGTEATASNAGMLVPGDSVAWANPAAITTLISQLLTRTQGFIRVHPAAGLGLIPWGIRFLLECLPWRVRRNITATHRLSAYSLDLLEQQQRELGLEFAFVRAGMTFLTHSGEEAETLARDRATLAYLGEHFEVRTPQGFGPEFGAELFTPGSGKGDALAFTRELAGHAEAAGVVFHRAVTVRSIITRGRRIVGLDTSRGPKRFDRVVIAAGARSRELARDCGVRLPILPVKGYALTVPPRDGVTLPELGGVDETRHVAFSTMATGLRLSSMAEFMGYNDTRSEASYESIREAGEALLPGKLDWARAKTFTGWRPSTPSSTPLIGSTRVDGLFVNSGHSHLGWTQATGSARMLADLITGVRPEIDPTPYVVH